MTTKQRAYLKSLAMTLEPIFQIGKVQHDTRTDTGHIQRRWKHES